MKKTYSVIFTFLLLQQFTFAQAPKTTTFDVCEVKPATELIKHETDAANIFKHLLIRDYQNNPEQQKKSVILCSSLDDDDKLIYANTNPFMSAVYMAYAQHRPLTISPDMIWLMIAQGLVIHVKENAEELRDVLVDHAGQVNLDVKRKSYHPTSRSFWEGIFPDFSKAIATNTKQDVWTLVSPKFSTTSMVEKAAFEITLMDAMSPYFTYSVSITCGIPSITLEGEYEDWVEIENRIQELKKYDLNWWTDDLEEIIGEFKLASQGKHNQGFWQDIFVENYVQIGCGTEAFHNGWSFKLFPYLKGGVDAEGEVNYIKNSLVAANKGKKHQAGVQMDMNNLPSGMSKAKVLLNDNGEMTMLNFNAGFVGYTQDEKTLSLRPNIQWFIEDMKRKPSEEELAKYEKGEN